MKVMLKQFNLIKSIFESSRVVIIIDFIRKEVADENSNFEWSSRCICIYVGMQRRKAAASDDDDEKERAMQDRSASAATAAAAAKFIN